MKYFRNYLCILASLFFLFLPDNLSALSGDILYVREDSVLARLGPGTNFPVITQVNKGSEVYEKLRQGVWIAVEIAETGQVGWIHSSLLTWDRESIGGAVKRPPKDIIEEIPSVPVAPDLPQIDSPQETVEEKETSPATDMAVESLATESQVEDVIIEEIPPMLIDPDLLQIDSPQETVEEKEASSVTDMAVESLITESQVEDVIIEEIPSVPVAPDFLQVDSPQETVEEKEASPATDMAVESLITESQVVETASGTTKPVKIAAIDFEWIIEESIIGKETKKYLNELAAAVSEEELKRSEREFTKQIISDVELIIDEYAAQEGYTHVLDKLGSGVVYVKEGHDITGDILTIYDNQIKIATIDLKWIIEESTVGKEAKKYLNELATSASEEELKRSEREFIKQIISDVELIIDEYTAQEGYTHVFDKLGSGVVYVKGHDITGDILAIYDGQIDP